VIDRYGEPRQLRSLPMSTALIPPRRSARRVGVGSFVLLGVAVLTGCSENFGAPESASEQGSSFTDMWRVFLIGAVIVAGLIYVLVAISVIRFRRRRNDDEIPGQRQYNIPLEIGYTIAPLVVVAVLFGMTLVSQENFTELSDDPDVTVEVVGFQWQWQFRYPESNIAVSGANDAPPVLVVPAGSTIRFELMADDVVHSFWVPAFLEKRDLIPEVDNAIDVTVREPGEWKGRCAEFCGLDHWQMIFTVKAVPADEFDAWVAEMQQLPQPVVSSDAPEAGA
jgi:cytochrome c oxidase subunit 2